MEVEHAVRTLLAVREYRPDPIPEEVVRKILEAGRLTASSRNRQEWDFVVVRDRSTLSRLGSLAKTGKFIADAPLAIAVVAAKGQSAYGDGARAVQDMMLVAWGAGVGTVWVGNMDIPEVKDLLGVPDDKQVVTVIPFGYPTKKLGAGKKKRKALAEVAHRERYGQPYPEG
jgi:nitroreductase